MIIKALDLTAVIDTYTRDGKTPLPEYTDPAPNARTRAATMTPPAPTRRIECGLELGDPYVGGRAIRPSVRAWSQSAAPDYAPSRKSDSKVQIKTPPVLYGVPRPDSGPLRGPAACKRHTASATVRLAAIRNSVETVDTSRKRSGPRPAPTSPRVAGRKCGRSSRTLDG